MPTKLVNLKSVWSFDLKNVRSVSLAKKNPHVPSPSVSTELILLISHQGLYLWKIIKKIKKIIPSGNFYMFFITHWRIQEEKKMADIPCHTRSNSRSKFGLKLEIGQKCINHLNDGRFGILKQFLFQICLYFLWSAL